MPPKPRPVRKPSAPKDAIATPASKDAAAPTPSTSSMPPPPDPVLPLGILEAEITALSSCLQNAVVKTGQVYAFYTDVRRLGIQQYAPRPPRSLTSSLGREIVKYDQLCDAMESHLLRAITVLQRDLAREEQRLKAEEEAAAAAAAATRAVTPSAASATTPPGSPTPSTQAELPDGSSRPRMSSVSIASARRQSTISFSSLSRPAFPHKLDLSASALRIHPEEMIPSGMSSPVTLAPRSARASVPPDIVIAGLPDSANRPVDIDLTGPDIDMAGPRSIDEIRHMGGAIDRSLGSSADKPIELDLDIDMDNFFGDAPTGGASNANVSMFGPDGGQLVKPKEEQIDVDNILGSFGPSNSENDIFGLGDSSAGGGALSGATAPSVADLQKSAVAAAPSPGTILAGLAAGHAPAAAGVAGQGPSFDFDMSTLPDNFFSEPAAGAGMNVMMGMDDLFNIGGNPSNPDGSAPSASGGT
ncbi:hypothetical protein C8Q74DRAFT_1337137 [Fomes fomentarius]|nr:hypothetical protein C8Q74DRAFT_1337137 [Fomes fomentarius]